MDRVSVGRDAVVDALIRPTRREHIIDRFPSFVAHFDQRRVVRAPEHLFALIPRLGEIERVARIVVVRIGGISGDHLNAARRPVGELIADSARRNPRKDAVFIRCDALPVVHRIPVLVVRGDDVRVRDRHLRGGGIERDAVVEIIKADLIILRISGGVHIPSSARRKRGKAQHGAERQREDFVHFPHVFTPLYTFGFHYFIINFYAMQ